MFCLWAPDCHGSGNSNELAVCSGRAALTRVGELPCLKRSFEPGLSVELVGLSCSRISDFAAKRSEMRSSNHPATGLPLATDLHYLR